MVWAFLLLLGIIAAIHAYDYRRSVQEYTFAQPETISDVKGVLSEKTPVVLNIGALPWRPEIAEKSSWMIETDKDAETDQQIPVAEWKEGITIGNRAALALTIGLNTGLGELDEARALWWLPGFFDSRVDILPSDKVVPLHWVDAERHWIGCSSGAPITLWLVHSRYRRFLPTTDEPVDPWNLTVTTAPWIGRVQYIPVRIHPDWCIGIPTHWGVAIRSEVTDDKKPSWIWTSNQHSPLSWLVSPELT